MVRKSRDENQGIKRGRKVERRAADQRMKNSADAAKKKKKKNIVERGGGWRGRSVGGNWNGTEAMEKRDALKGERERERRGCRELSIPQISLLGRGKLSKLPRSEGKDGAWSVLRWAIVSAQRGRTEGWIGEGGQEGQEVGVTRARYRLQIAGDERKRGTPRVRKPQ